jgi:4-hydroxy-tetrahydrodipicolinate synthase
LGCPSTLKSRAGELIAEGVLAIEMAALAGDLPEARALNNQLMPLHTRLFVESNPIPAKWALLEMGRIESGIRLPLTALDAKFHDTVRAALRESGC